MEQARAEMPRDPLAAVMHPDPYPYYAALAAERPLYRDEGLGLWVASGKEAIEAVLEHPLCRVRPVAEPVPRALVGNPAGEIFSRLVRMNDGDRHCPWKRAIASTLGGLAPARAREAAERWALRRRTALEPARYPERIAPFAMEVTACVTADLLGFPADRIEETAALTGDFVRCLAPGAVAEEIERGAQAARHLLLIARSALDDGRAGLLRTLFEAAKDHGTAAAEVLICNAIGFLSQGYEATAGLIGNTLLALARNEELRERVKAGPRALPGVVELVLRDDPPVQNTRRFVAGDATIAGASMKSGDAILVVLAALRSSPSASRRAATFGHGAHACPGSDLAVTVACAAVEALLAGGLSPELLAGAVRYRPSLNVRIPLFGGRP